MGILAILKCVVTGTHLVRVPPEIERLAIENPDNDYPVRCERCHYPAKAYFSKKKNKVTIYCDDDGSIFGDAWRD